MKLFSFKSLRILLLLILLAYVLIYTKSQRLETMAWIDPLQVVILPINADGHEATASYIRQLNASVFEPIDAFTLKQADKYEVVSNPPTSTILGPEIEGIPPAPPGEGASALSIGWWSLKLRYWAWKHTPDQFDDTNTVAVFVLYQQPRPGEALAHSLGLQKGLIGIVHAFAKRDQNGQNNIVIAHEMLHTVGATDKYDANGLPVYPDGYASPNSTPLYPQKRCEIMAGRIAQSAGSARMAGKLRRCVVGETTAREINWLPSS
ncbi:MAG: hypothetical protein ACWA5Q_10565 [bacterium]